MIGCVGQSGVRVRVEACPAAFVRAPERNEVFVWVVDLTCPPVHADVLFARLTAEEQARATRYKIAKAREQFVIGRGLLRGLLAHYLDLAPASVPLAYLPSGKPVLAPELPPLHFNVTHTDGILVLAAARYRLGVDVERVRFVENMEGLVQRYFSITEGNAFREVPEHHRPASFFRGWTCKEAVIKAAGATVSCLADFDVELHPHLPPCVKAIRDPQLAGAGLGVGRMDHGRQRGHRARGGK